MPKRYDWYYLSHGDGYVKSDRNIFRAMVWIDKDTIYTRFRNNAQNPLKKTAINLSEDMGERTYGWSYMIAVRMRDGMIFRLKPNGYDIDRSFKQIPAWVFDPLLRAIRYEQIKKGKGKWKS